MRVSPTMSLGVGLAALLIGYGGCSDGAPANTAPTAITHEVYFPINTGKHGGIDCNTCHGEFDTFTKFSCLTGCHLQADTDPNHVGVDGYAWNSADCYRCHPTGDKFGIDRKGHVKYFPIDTGDKHEAVGCNSCHANTANRQDITCAGTCHDMPISSNHTDVGGYQWSSPLCLRCHADSQINPVATHLPFSISGRAKHHNSSCIKCHPAMRTDKPYGADFNQIGCFDCHNMAEMNNHHAGFAGYQPVATSCVQSGCHQDGRTP